jgi:hypothetical protein
MASNNDSFSNSNSSDESNCSDLSDFSIDSFMYENSAVHPRYNIQALTLPIKVDGDWLDRGFYSIRLKGYTSNAKNSRLRVFGVEYDLRLNLHHVPPHSVMRAFKFVMYEVFFIMKHNQYVEVGGDHLRLVLISDQLKEGALNLRHVELNKDGADMFIREVERTMQSHETLLMDKDLRIYFASTKVQVL